MKEVASKEGAEDWGGGGEAAAPGTPWQGMLEILLFGISRSEQCSCFFCFLVGDGLVKPEALNKKAIQIINRVRDKLTGKLMLVFATSARKRQF